MTPGPQRTYELIAGHPALDLVNTLDWRFRPSGSEDLLTCYQDLVHFARQSRLLASNAWQSLHAIPPRTSISILRSARHLRETLATILYAAVGSHAPVPADLASFERHIHAARLHQQIAWKHTSLSWEWSCPLADPALPLWLLALSASELVSSNGIVQLRQCGNPECRWLFLDTSRNHTRRWCEMKLCGNRMKARRFQARRRP